MPRIITLLNDQPILQDIEQITDQHYLPDELPLPFGGALICSRISNASLVIENLEAPDQISTQAYCLTGKVLATLPDVFDREFHSPSFILYPIRAGVVLSSYRRTGRVSSTKGVVEGSTTLLHPHPLN